MFLARSSARHFTSPGRVGFTVTSSTPFAEVLNVTLPRVGALLPFLMLVLILVFRPRGLMGTRDT